MKNAPAAVASLVVSTNVLFRADLYTLTLLNGTIYRWTTCDRDITYGGNTWLSNRAVLRRGNLRQTSRLEVDTIDVYLGGTVQLSGTAISLLAVRGAFDDARLQIDHLVGLSLADALSRGPVMAWFEGRVAGLEPQPLEVRMSVTSELAALNVPLPRFYFQLACMNAVYDPVCTMVKATFTDAATVSNNSPTTTSVPSTTAAVIAKAADYYKLGVIVFTSGALAGVRRAIKGFSVSAGVGTLTLGIPLPVAPGVGDSFSVYPGCDKTQGTCNTKFSNLVNFRGFPHIPAPEGAI